MRRFCSLLAYIWLGGASCVLFNEVAKMMGWGNAAAVEQHKSCFAEWDKVIAMGDLHGDLHNTMLLLEGLQLVNSEGSWIAPPRTLLIQMGDIADRGRDSFLIYKIFRQMSRSASLNGSKVVQLIGNHEAMNLCGMFNAVNPVELKRYYNNSIAVLKKAWSPVGVIGKYIRENFHTVFSVEDMVFVHAGLVPRYAQFPFDAINSRLFTEIDEESCNVSPISIPKLEATALATNGVNLAKEQLLNEVGPLWTRLLSMERDEVSCPMLDESLKMRNSTLMVVGHTPTVNGRITQRCNGKLLMIDTSIGISRNIPRALLVDKNCSVFEVSVSSTDGIVKHDAGSHKEVFERANGEKYVVGHELVFRHRGGYIPPATTSTQTDMPDVVYIS